MIFHPQRNTMATTNPETDIYTDCLRRICEGRVQCRYTMSIFHVKFPFHMTQNVFHLLYGSWSHSDVSLWTIVKKTQNLVKGTEPWLLIGCWGRHCVKSKVMTAVDWVRARHGYSQRGWGSASLDSWKSRDRWWDRCGEITFYKLI